MISLMFLSTSREVVAHLPCGHTWRKTMSLYKRGGIWHYDFSMAGQRFRGSTKEGVLSRARKIEALFMAEAKERGRSLVPRRAPLLSEFAVRFFHWVENSQLEPKSKR